MDEMRWRKSSYSEGGEDNHCIELACGWQKSSYSADGEDNHCVELARTAGPAVLLRESDDPQQIIATGPAPLRGFLRAAKAGAFDAVARHP
ncbi:DUF397 domain-containing protein [Streptomyces sp. P1-3]|uniref:DUF397 domain-containing protein n=1 Tax=Streptomyces sp. P1-3 TaxID=3421658 RepID=UPI003D35B6BC